MPYSKTAAINAAIPRNLFLAGVAACLFTPPHARAGTATYSVLYNFTDPANEGSDPIGPFFIDKNVIYGTTAAGGPKNEGTVFSFDLATGQESLLFSYPDTQTEGYSPVGLARDGNYAYALTATDWLTQYSLKKGTTAPIKLPYTDGVYVAGFAPQGATDVGGTLYMITAEGGTNNQGVVAAFNPKTGAFTTLHSFTGAADGGQPYNPLTAANGVLYGATTSGGTSGNGVIFAMDPSTGAETVLYNFTGGLDGAYPNGVIYSKATGLLYGSEPVGGTNGDGTIFSLNPATGAFQTLYSFTGGADGAFPLYAPTLAGHVLYEPSEAGGNDYGAVISFDLDKSVETTIHTFTSGTDGASPYSPLIKVGNDLYGTTQGSFTNPVSASTIYKIAIKR